MLWWDFGNVYVTPSPMFLQIKPVRLTGLPSWTVEAFFLWFIIDSLSGENRWFFMFPQCHMANGKRKPNVNPISISLNTIFCLPCACKTMPSRWRWFYSLLPLEPLLNKEFRQNERDKCNGSESNIEAHM